MLCYASAGKRNPVPNPRVDLPVMPDRVEGIDFFFTLARRQHKLYPAPPGRSEESDENSSLLRNWLRRVRVPSRALKGFFHQKRESLRSSELAVVTQRRWCAVFLRVFPPTCECRRLLPRLFLDRSGLPFVTASTYGDFS